MGGSAPHRGSARRIRGRQRAVTEVRRVGGWRKETAGGSETPAVSGSGRPAATKRQAAACLFLHNMFLKTKKQDRSKKVRKTGEKLREWMLKSNHKFIKHKKPSVHRMLIMYKKARKFHQYS